MARTRRSALACRASLAVCLSLGACAPATQTTDAGAPPDPQIWDPTYEQEVTFLPLDATSLGADPQLSGLAWYGDTLLALPQYADEIGVLYRFERADILDAIDGEPTALVAGVVAFDAGGVRAQVSGFGGFEAIVVIENDVYLTIEARAGAGSAGFLVHGTIAGDLDSISLDVGSLVSLPVSAVLPNTAFEAAFASADAVTTLFEANGAQFSNTPTARRVDLATRTVEAIGLETIEYRITDVTAPDGDGRIWAMNYFFVGDDFLAPDTDALIDRWGEGETHQLRDDVERLIELQVLDETITFSDRPPLQLRLPLDGDSRNWEGIARLDERGVLLVTDRYPQTLLGFVPLGP